MSSKFSHLHTHSHYSLLNALPKIKDLVKKAKGCEMPALALTDNGNLYGAIEFYKECQKENIKPIIGVDFYVATRTRNDKQSGIDNRRTRLILLAKNINGYKNLLKLVTKSHLEGFYYRPRIDRELIEKYKDDLVCISPHFSGAISQALKMGDYEKAEELSDWYKNIFENFYLEITHHPEIDGQAELKNKIIDFAKKENIPLVASQDVYYINPDDKKARDILMSIQGSNFGGGSDRNDDEDFSFIDPKTASKYFKDQPEAIENIQKIVDMCNLELELGKWVFPKLEIAPNTTYDDELRKLAYAGIEKRGLSPTKEVTDRLEYELKIIKDKGYSVYFLIVSDLLRFAHTNGILTTIRGSVAGSLTTYVSNITNVNPLEYKLPFERFLNPERPSAPDIDMDYADNRRDEVIQYARDKYGDDKVAQIGTFGTMMARGAVRDVTRALGHPYDLGDKIAKLIPMGSQGFPMTIDHALEIEPELKKMYDKEKNVKEIIDFAKKIEGCARHISVHAAGVVISPLPLDEYTPTQMDPKGGKIITQFDMHAVEDAGLIKFDFLGIRNLAILADAVRLVKKNQDIDVDIEKIRTDDPKTFEMLAKGETMGLFQLNGAGMTRYLKELQPETIHDINAMVALYRPGPMESIPEYIKRKHNPRLISYMDPRMEEILKQSYGIITYQDDVMLIAIKIGGYSWLEADKLRKAMGKKIPALMEEQKSKFKDGCVKNGMTKEKVDTLWQMIETFAAYGFNKAHAASYGRVAYQTAYMKAHYPVEYMTAIMTADSGDIEKIAETIAECKRMKIDVLPPDINESYTDFTIVKNETGKDQIRFGLCTIKNFGVGIAEIIINERERGGKFKSLADFLDRIKDRNLNKKSLSALTQCGAMDSLGERGQILENMEELLAYNKEGGRQPENQNSLFGLMENNSSIPTLKLKETKPASNKEKLLWEKELLGLYISGHPLDEFKEQLKGSNTNIKKTKEKAPDGVTTVIAGVVEEIKIILTKKGAKMAFLKISDFTGDMEVVVFPKVMEEFKNFLEKEKCILIKGRISHRNDEVSMMVEKVKELSNSVTKSLK